MAKTKVKADAWKFANLYSKKEIALRTKGTRVEHKNFKGVRGIVKKIWEGVDLTGKTNKHGEFKQSTLFDVKWDDNDLPGDPMRWRAVSGNLNAKGYTLDELNIVK